MPWEGRPPSKGARVFWETAKQVGVVEDLIAGDQGVGITGVKVKFDDYDRSMSFATSQFMAQFTKEVPK